MRYRQNNQRNRPLTGKRPLPARKRPAANPQGLQAGMVITMPVKRTSEFGYFLAYEDAEVLLHRTEATRELEIGEEVEVFLYHDHENRLAATMQMPYVKMGEYGWLKVEEVSPRMGVFLYNGIKKDLLLFVDDLPKLREEWPQKGDRLLVTLTRDEQGRLLAKPAGEKEMVAFAQPAGKEMLNKRVEATVYKVIQAGAFLFTENEHILFIHRDEMTEPLRLGQTVICRVSFVREDGRLNGSMRQRKEIQYSEDADRLLQYLVERDGAMPYTDDTPPDTIKRQFQMSKAAFKRALGKLLRERLIEQEEGWTHLNRDVLDKYRREEGQTELPD